MPRAALKNDTQTKKRAPLSSKHIEYSDYLIKKYTYIFIALLLSLLLSLWLAASHLIAPVNHSLPHPSVVYPLEDVTINQVAGWFSPVANSTSCVLLLHGVRADRRSMSNRVHFLRQLGYNTLQIDLQAHGATPGVAITFGRQESLDVHLAVAYLRQQKQCRKIGVIGMSLGGAASLLGSAPIQVDALVLEAVYPSIEQAVYNRLAMRIGPAATFVAPLFYQQLPIRLNIPLSELQPAQAIRKLQSPVLVIGGEQDLHTPPEETRQLYQHAPTAKKLWLITGAAHQDFYDFSPNDYQQHVGEFLRTYL